MKLTPERLAAFCAALAETCNVGRACTAVGISRWCAYQWKRDMPEFSAAWDDAMRAGLLALEDEAHRRAFDGVDEPLVHLGRFAYLERECVDARGRVKRDKQGRAKMEPVLGPDGQPVIASIKKYSDTLAIFLLKAHAPEKYRDNSKVELTGRLSVEKLTDEELDAELAELHRMVSAALPPGQEDGRDGG